jgi:hypothetical protein
MHKIKLDDRAFSVSLSLNRISENPYFLTVRTVMSLMLWSQSWSLNIWSSRDTFNYQYLSLFLDLCYFICITLVSVLVLDYSILLSRLVNAGTDNVREN